MKNESSEADILRMQSHHEKDVELIVVIPPIISHLVQGVGDMIMAVVHDNIVLPIAKSIVSRSDCIVPITSLGFVWIQFEDFSWPAKGKIVDCDIITTTKVMNNSLGCSNSGMSDDWY